MKHIRQFDIVDEDRSTGQQICVFATLDALADEAGRHISMAPCVYRNCGTNMFVASYGWAFVGASRKCRRIP